MMLNLDKATKIYILLKPFLFEAPRNLDVNLYLYLLLLQIKETDPEKFYEVLSISEDKLKEYFLSKNPDKIFSEFRNLLCDNKILDLKFFYEDA